MMIKIRSSFSHLYFKFIMDPEIRDWIQRRSAAVREIYSAYQCLTELGIDLPDVSTDFQIACPLPGHGPDNRPSARYYGSNSTPHFYCFKCKEKHDGISLYAKLKNIRFMDALQELERRFHIRIPRRPESPEIVEPSDRDSNYISNQWSDVPRMINVLELKLARTKSKCSLSDYIKFCRVLDNVQYDYDKLNKSTPDMIIILKKLLEKMDDIISFPDDLSLVE